MDVFPDFEGLSGIGDLQQVVGALLMFVLVIAVLMLIVSGIIWAVAASTGNYSASAKGRVGVLVALGTGGPRRCRGRVDELADRRRPTTLTPIAVFSIERPPRTGAGVLASPGEREHLAAEPSNAS